MGENNKLKRTVEGAVSRNGWSDFFPRPLWEMQFILEIRSYFR